MSKTSVQLIFVGGFLGAGKTTLLWEAARRLTGRGLRVGLITNDQAPDLVDTAFLAGRGLAVREVAGSCFCCNFPGLLSAANGLADDIQADVLLAEPVGSCTDLSATLLQPLKDRYRQDFVLAPLSVLADPERLRDVLAGRTSLHPSAAYIVRKQVEEADLVVLNKADTLTPAAAEDLERLVAATVPGSRVLRLSALSGQGVEAWLDAVLSHGPAGGRIADVNYDTYAEGEAVLGWLNASLRLTPAGPDAVDWRQLCTTILERLRMLFDKKNADVGHVKLFLAAGTDSLIGNLARSGGPVSVRGQIAGAPTEAQLILNARVAMTPEALEATVRQTLADVCQPSAVRPEVLHLQSLQPGRPNPTHRYTKVV
jgi:Ni2+-binding GTPase involved in maturation of urease and hydrogenase